MSAVCAGVEGLCRRRVGDGAILDCPRIAPDAGREEVLTAAVREFKLELKWSTGEWEQWQELQESEEFAKVKEGAKATLDNAKEYNSKGKGKGPGKANPE